MSILLSTDVTELKALAAHVLRHLARAGARGRLVRLDELAADIGARREDVRDVVARLHVEGHVDATRMKLTMSGLAIAASMRSCLLKPARPVQERAPESKVA